MLNKEENNSAKLLENSAVNAWVIDLDYTKFNRFNKVTSKYKSIKEFFLRNKLQLRIIRDDNMGVYDGVKTYCFYIGFELDHDLYELGNWGFESDEQMLDYIKNENNLDVSSYVQDKIIMFVNRVCSVEPTFYSFIKNIKNISKTDLIDKFQVTIQRFDEKSKDWYLFLCKKNDPIMTVGDHCCISYESLLDVLNTLAEYNIKIIISYDYFR